MSNRVQLSLPRIVQRGEATSLTLPLRSEADAELTATSGTLTVKLGSKTLVDAAALSAFGPPVSYSLLAATTTDESLSEEWLEIWDLDIGTYTHAGYLVRYPYHSHVTDAALTDLHAEILYHLPPGETTAEKYRRSAKETIERRLIAKGRRPWLIVDAWALYDAERHLAVSLWASDTAARVKDAIQYTRLAAEHERKYERAFDGVTFRYDEDSDGTIADGEEQQAAQPILTLSAGRSRRSWWLQ